MIEGREVSQQKLKSVEDLAEMIKSYKVVGILTLQKTPSSVLHSIKSGLKDRIKIKVARKSTIGYALEKAGKGELKEHLSESPALILTNDDPFKVYIDLEKSKVDMYAKPGTAAEEAITVKAGPTELPPGPAISTLTKISLPAKIQGPTISILRDKVVCEAGEIISLDVASVLQLLKIKTMKAGLNIVLMEEDGKIYTKDQLYIDQERLMTDINLASANALNLSLNISYPTKDNIQIMLMMAHLNAKALENSIGVEKKAEPEKAQEEVKEGAGEKPIEENEESKNEVAEEPKKAPEQQEGETKE